MREQTLNGCHQQRHARRLFDVHASMARPVWVIVATVSDERDVACLHAFADLRAVPVTQRMIQNGDGQGTVFGPLLRLP